MGQKEKLHEYLRGLEGQMFGTLIEHQHFPGTHLDQGHPLDVPASRCLSFAQPGEGGSAQTLRQVIQDPWFAGYAGSLNNSITELRRYLERSHLDVAKFEELYDYFLAELQEFEAEYGTVRSGSIGLRLPQGGVPNEAQLQADDAAGGGAFPMPNLLPVEVDIPLLYQELGFETQDSGGGAASETRGMA